MRDVPRVLRRLALTAAERLDSWAAGTGAGDADAALAEAFAHDLRASASSASGIGRGTPRPVRAMAWMPAVLDRADRLEDDLLDAAVAAIGAVRWTEFYAEDEWTRPFVSGFANGEGIGPDGRLRDDAVIVGLFLLAPHTLYPPHAHPAEEFYVPLVGDMEFEVGAGTGHRLVSSGDVVLHHSDVSHSIRTRDHPAFAVFGWRGDLGGRSWYRHDMSDPREPVRHPTVLKD